MRISAEFKFTAHEKVTAFSIAKDHRSQVHFEFKCLSKVNDTNAGCANIASAEK
jgi:hypothetical protein